MTLPPGTDNGAYKCRCTGMFDLFTPPRSHHHNRMPPRSTRPDIAAKGMTLPLLLLVAVASAGANFIGPFGPRTGTGGGAAVPSEPTIGGGLTHDEITSLLEHRHALVVAGKEIQTAVRVSEGLAEVGASVVLACENPERARRAIKRSFARRAPRASRKNGDDGNGASEESADPVKTWTPGCEIRAIELASPQSVCQFAAEMLAEERPLHVIVNCADDIEPFYSRGAPSTGPKEGDWERTTGQNHLGPLLLTQLLLDQMVSTMRRDAAAAKKAGIGLSSSGKLRSDASRTPTQPRGEGAATDDSPPSAPELHARPHPMPLGRVVTLGLPSRLGGGPAGAGDPPAVRGLHLSSRNFTSWRAYRCAHEANTLAAIQLSRMLSVIRTPGGECIEVNVVRPPTPRWLPSPLRRLLGSAEGAALTATFLASTPVKGMNGLFFADFASEPPWRKSAVKAAAAQGRAARHLYASSMALIGSPAAEWRSEATMLMRGYMARQQQRGAAVRAPTARAPSAAPRSRGARKQMGGERRDGRPKAPVEIDVDELLQGQPQPPNGD